MWNLYPHLTTADNNASQQAHSGILESKFLDTETRRIMGPNVSSCFQATKNVPTSKPVHSFTKNYNCVRYIHTHTVRDRANYFKLLHKEKQSQECWLLPTSTALRGDGRRSGVQSYP